MSDMHITLWGTRGSIPVFGSDFMRHGGSTTCIEIEFDSPSEGTPERVVIDLGTGCVGLGRERDNWSNTLVLQTHLHWDHIQGFPFFAPLFRPDAKFEFWSVDRDQKTMREVLAEQMTAPTFPVPIDILPADLTFKSLKQKGSQTIGELTIMWDEVWHPSGSTMWRLEYRGSSFVFTGDVELRQGSFDTVKHMACDADVLLMDAQYFPEEYATREGWGHSTPLDALDVADQANVGHLILTHHDPSHTDDRLAQKLRLARRLAPAGLTVDLAFDRMTLTLGTEEAVPYAS